MNQFKRFAQLLLLMGAMVIAVPAKAQSGFSFPTSQQVGCDQCQSVECDGGCQQGHLAGDGVRYVAGVDSRLAQQGKVARWRDAELVPWESLAYGEYIGPYRTPHVPEYRIRVADQLEFIYMLTREQSSKPYELYVGDVIEITSAVDEGLNQTNITILSDGTISLSLVKQVRAAGKTIGALQKELNERYTKYLKNPAVVVRVLQSDTPLRDLINAVDARAGQGGQTRSTTVSPDGTIQLPLIGNIPAVGLSLDEIRREVNARYHARVSGIEVTPTLIQIAPRFAYVVGEVGRPGRVELNGPTTVMQALALAQGFGTGGNIRQAIVFRRDQNWRMMATKLDLSGALYGRTPHPSDDIWLRHSDIILIPKRPIQRLTEAIDLYLTRGVYQIVPAFDFDLFLGQGQALRN